MGGGRSGNTCRGSRGIGAAWPACGGRRKKGARLGIEQLTLYCLSSENWKRPQPELDFLMHLLEQYMIEERNTIMDNDIRVSVIGRRDDIPAATLEEMDKTVRLTAGNGGMRLCLAINYGARTGITRCGARHCRRGGSGPDATRRDYRADHSRAFVYGGDAGPRFVNSHGRRNADQQLFAVADQLRRDLGNRKVLAGICRGRFARSDSGICPARSAVWRVESRRMTQTRGKLPPLNIRAASSSSCWIAADRHARGALLAGSNAGARRTPPEDGCFHWRSC